MSTNQQSDATKIRTPVGILSYPHLFTPQKSDQPDQPDKYGATIILFPPGADLSRFEDAAIRTALENADLKPLVTAVATAAREKWGDKAEAMLRSGQAKSPFRKEGDAYGTDLEAKGYPKGVVFLNLRSTNKPQIVSRFPGPDGKATIITDPALIYPGCLVRISGRAFAYDKKGNRGVAFGLNNIQKWLDGPRMDNRVNATDEFSADLSTEAPGIDDVLAGLV